MPLIELEIEVAAPIEVVFDLSRSVEAHVASTGGTGERPVAGVTSGLLGLDDEVTWRARHFGVEQELTSRIARFERPRYFRDSMVSGAFKRFDHDHHFEFLDGRTEVRDRFDFDAPLGPLGHLANALFLTRYMRRFLWERMVVIKGLAESGEGARFL